MNDIERLKFAVNVGLANSFRAFLRNINSEPSVSELLVLAGSREVALDVLKRLVSLSRLRVDFRYLNRFDVPMATYLWVLSRTFPELARAGAEATADLPRTWWADQVCGYILGDWSQKPAASTSAGVTIMSGDLTNVNTTNVAATTSRFSIEPLPGFETSKESSQVKSDADESSEVRYTEENGNGAVPTYTTNSASKSLAEPQ
jgi:hypothetical protein